MPVVVSLLRAVNVGNRQVSKERLVAIHEAAGCVEPRTFIASGNLIFTTRERNLATLTRRIEAEFERAAGFRSEAILRTRDELERVAARNAFARRKDLDGARLVVTFLAAAPTAADIAAAMAIEVGPEEMHIAGREMYVYYPNGIGRSKFPAAKVARALRNIPGTGRNWNTVLKLIDLATARGSTGRGAPRKS